MTLSRAAVLALALALPLSACSSSSARSGGSTGTTPAAHPRTVLHIAYQPHGQGGPTRRWRLTCRPTGGSHPHPARACAELGRHPHAFAPSTRACPFLVIRGAPLAHVTGHIGRRRVDYLARPVCGAEWKQLPVLLTGR